MMRRQSNRGGYCYSMVAAILVMAPMRKAREGFAIFVVLIGVLVLSTLTLTALDMGTLESRSARATRVSASALYAAETGVSVVRAGTWPSLAVGGTWDPGQMTLPNGSRYRPVIQRRDNGVGRMQIYSLTVEGWSPGPRGGEASVQVWATRFVTGLFEAALAAKGNVTLSGNNPGSIIDSYDSRLGDYGALLGDGSTNKDSTGSVLANGNVTLSGTSQILGDVAISGTINNTSSNPDPITGTETTGVAKIDYPVENCPDYTPIPTVYKVEGGKGNVRIENMTYTLTSGTYSFHDFIMGGGSGASLVIPAGNVVKIYLSGKLDAGGQNTSINNESENPRSLFISACNRGQQTNTTQWNLHGGTGAYMTVWAPNNKVYLQGNSPLYGAVVANDFTADQGASIHYDIALGESDALSTIMPRSWRQLLR